MLYYLFVFFLNTIIGVQDLLLVDYDFNQERLWKSKITYYTFYFAKKN